MLRNFMMTIFLSGMFCTTAAADVMSVGHACSYFGEAMPEEVSTFGSINEATDTLDKILGTQGLDRNFQIEAASVPNAAAVIQGSERFILYNPDFMEEMRSSTGTKWAPISILAHEVGHHLNGHTLKAGGSRPPSELQADKFSGYALQRLGASLKDATAAMRHFGSENGSPTHPAKWERLAAISAGWKQACDADTSCNGSSSESSTTTEAPIAPTTVPTQPTQPNPQMVWTDQCLINGENVRISATGQVYSNINNQVIGQKGQTMWPTNCIFDLVRADGARYCVQQSGYVFFGTPIAVGRCVAMN